ncbi:MAG: DNA polymerase III subunit gamma/tau, partial [Rhodoferax sp.]|nr:DNA polymerase III subunit gamma/tau [Rhodoferax sp.]
DLGLAPDEYAALTMVLLRLLAFKPKAEKKTLAKPDSPLSEGATPGIGAGVAAAMAPVSAAPVPAPARSTPNPAAATVQPWEDQPAARRFAAQAGAAAAAGAPPAGTAPNSPKPVPRPQVAAPQTVAAHDGTPAGKRLPVHDPEPFAAEAHDQAMRSGRGALETAAPVSKPASKVRAVPVVEQSEAQADFSHNPAAPVLVATEEGAFWHDTVQQLIAAQSITALARELAMQSQLIARDTDQWLLRVENGTINQPAARERLGNALLQLGHEVKLVVEIGRVTDCPARRNTAASDEKLRAAERIIQDDPFVQRMVRDFGAKIVPGSIKPLHSQ